MGKTDELYVTVNTEDRVLRADDPKEEATEGVTTTGDIVEEDSSIIV